MLMPAGWKRVQYRVQEEASQRGRTEQMAKRSDEKDQLQWAVILDLERIEALRRSSLGLESTVVVAVKARSAPSTQSRPQRPSPSANRRQPNLGLRRPSQSLLQSRTYSLLREHSPGQAEHASLSQGLFGARCSLSCSQCSSRLAARSIMIPLFRLIFCSSKSLTRENSTASRSIALSISYDMHSYSTC